jgi:PAS domain S-box-containing protein
MLLEPESTRLLWHRGPSKKEKKLMSLSSPSDPEERHDPLQGLKASTDRFLAVMQGTADLFWMLTPAGDMQESSPSWQAFTGQQDRSCQGPGWRNAVYPADQPQLETMLHHCVLSSQPAEAACHIRRSDGVYRLLRVRAFPVCPHEMIRELVVCGTDSTSEQMSEAHIQRAMNASGVGMWQQDLVTGQFVGTDSCKGLYGIASDAPLSYGRFLALVHPDDRARISERRARALAEKKDYEAEYRVIWPDGSLHWLTSRARYIFAIDNQPGDLIGAVIDITELKQAEEQIGAILESITDAFLQIDREWRFTYANRRANTFLGISQGAFLGQRLWDVRPDLLGTPLEQHLRAIMDTRQTTRFDCFLPRPQKWVEVHVYPMQDGLSLYLQDITERKHMERERDQQTVRLTLQASLLNLAHDAILVRDPQSRVVCWNQGAEALYGWTPQEATGQVTHTLLQTGFPQPLETIEQQLEQEGQWEGELTHTCRDGRQIIVESRWALVRDEAGRPSAILEINRDITERKCAEEALRESDVRFRHLVNSNLIGITVSDSGGTIHEANDAFLSLVGYSREEVASGQVHRSVLTAPECQTQTAQKIEELRTTGMFQPYEKAFVTKTGKRVPVLVGGTLFHREGSAPSQICFILDLTARKEIERQKDLMLGITGHELKTPLAALRGTLQLVQRRLKRTITTNQVSPEWSTFCQGLTKNLEDSVHQTDVQTRLINDLLDVSRITANTLQLEQDHCDLVTIVRATVEDWRVIAPERVLMLDLPEQTVVNVLADRDRISQVVSNYVTNALRYSRPDQPVHIGLTAQEDMIRVWVRDQGPGLSAEAQKDLWQRFHQIKGVPVLSGSGKGLGLGLSICQTLIAQHEGEVGVESTPGEGSTFWFTLPMVT